MRLTPRSVLVVLSLLLACRPALAQPDAPATEVEQYRVGPGDELQISIHSGAAGEEGIVLNFPVAGDGNIDVVHAGRMTVTGLSTSEIQARIRRRLQEAGYMQKPFVSVNVTKYLSQCVNVAGAVTKQGRFCLQGTTRLLDILSMAEGVDEEHASRTVVIQRAGATEPIRVDRFDLIGADFARSQAANIRVLAGDNINVPVKSRFCINGPLESAGCYPFDDGASLHQAISLAGGIKDDSADTSNVTIRRRSGIEIKVSLDELEALGTPAPLLEADDQITIATFARMRFCVNGMVEEPGCTDYVGGISIDSALSMTGGLQPNKADRQHIVVRRIVDGQQREFVVNIDEASDRGARFLIEADDQITVPALDCVITVGGGVRTPQQVEYKTGMTLTDAIQAAGGSIDPAGWAIGKLQAVTLKRGEQVQTIDAKAIMKGKGSDPLLQCGDRIFVPSRAIGGL